MVLAKHANNGTDDDSRSQSRCRYLLTLVAHAVPTLGLMFVPRLWVRCRSNIHETLTFAVQ